MKIKKWHKSGFNNDGGLFTGSNNTGADVNGKNEIKILRMGYGIDC
jgi:hypothetical protein